MAIIVSIRLGTSHTTNPFFRASKTILVNTSLAMMTRNGKGGLLSYPFYTMKVRTQFIIYFHGHGKIVQNLMDPKAKNIRNLLYENI
jgi:hypothetical protein